MKNSNQTPPRDFNRTFAKKLADINARIARMEEMQRAGKVRPVWVGPHVVSEHARSGYWRAYYPPRPRKVARKEDRRRG